MNQTSKLIDCINRCMLPKLTTNLDEKEIHIEYDIRNKTLPQNFQTLQNYLCKVDLLSSNYAQDASLIISSLLNLCIELNCNSPWNKFKFQEYTNQLNNYFAISWNVRLDCILYQNNVFNREEIFYTLLEGLHKKITSEDFKKYPGPVAVYCHIIKDVKQYDIKLRLLEVMPICLILIDDYISTNKIKGLECCLAILQCLTLNDFESGNYYEVLHRSLMKKMTEKDVDVIKKTHSCLLELCKIIPPNVKCDILEDIYSNALDQLYTESNLYRKAEFIEFTKNIISFHKDNCIGINNFVLIMNDNLDMCTNNSVAEVLLEKTLKCIEEWIKYCWCVWKLSSNHKIISTLLKVLYVSKDEEICKYIQKIIKVLISLCNDEEKLKIQSNLDVQFECDSCVFKERINEIRISVT